MGQATTSIVPSAVVSSLLDVNVPAVNTSAVVTYAAVAGLSHTISGVAWSYSGGAPTGSLTITDGPDTIFSIDVTSTGARFIPFQPHKRGTVGLSMVVTLGAGGSGVSGKLTVINHWTA